MKELIQVIATALVDHPEEVVVLETETEKEIKLQLKVAPDDMGKIIGKQGKIAKAIRTVVRASGSHSNKKIIVDIQ
ncbi:MAG: KH domain-containing protein [Lachnoclostridium sp.]|nr:KH domain-containing protein [Lachnoclostridium sp.]